MWQKIKTFYLNLRNKSKKSPYELVGGESGVKRLVESFYHEMQTKPEAKNCLRVHQNGITQDVKEKLFDFLSGWFGGPNLFMQKHGHPRMRARHFPFKITAIERDEWLWCMKNALKNHSPRIKSKHQKLMLNSFTALAHRIQNS